MCTKEEVKEVVKAAALPPWLRNGLMVGAFALLSWTLTEVHLQDGRLEMIKHSNSDEIATLKLVLSTQNGLLTSRLEILVNELSNIKAIAIERSKDRYTGTQARSYEKLMKEQMLHTHRRHDESQKRQDRTDIRLDKIEESIKK